MKTTALFRSRAIRFAFPVILLLAISGPAQTKPSAIKKMPDINGYLKNRVRTDVGGEGLWMPQLDQKLTRWLAAEPGFIGPVYYVHATDFQGLFKYEFNSSSSRLTPQAIKHEWTPAYVKTRYRLHDLNGVSAIEIEETKFINDQEEAFSTVEVFNTTTARQTLSVAVIDLLTPSPPTADGFTTISRGISGHIKFKPTTYYFTDLEIEKYYAIQGSGFARPNHAPLITHIALKPKAKTRFTVRLVFDNGPIEKSPKYKFDLPDAALDARIKAFNQWFADNVP
jgi:hypothetical protein